MSNIPSDMQICKSLIDRRVENIYCKLKDFAFLKCPHQFKPMLNNYIVKHEHEWNDYLDNKVNEMITIAFIDDTTSLDEGLMNIEGLLNSMFDNFITENLGISPELVSIGLQIAFGKDI